MFEAYKIVRQKKNSPRSFLQYKRRLNKTTNTLLFVLLAACSPASFSAGFQFITTSAEYWDIFGYFPSEHLVFSLDEGCPTDVLLEEVYGNFVAV